MEMPDVKKPKPRRVLILDDQSRPNEALTTVLEANHFIVDWPEDISSGLRSLYETYPDVIILELAMTRLDGIDVLQSIHQVPRHSHTPVIIYTLANIRTLRDIAIQRGATRFLSKHDRTPEELTNVIQMTLQPVVDAEIKLRMMPPTELDIHKAPKNKPLPQPKLLMDDEPEENTKPTFADRVSQFFQKKNRAA